MNPFALKNIIKKLSQEGMDVVDNFNLITSIERYKYLFNASAAGLLIGISSYFGSIILDTEVRPEKLNKYSLAHAENTMYETLTPDLIISKLIEPLKSKEDIEKWNRLNLEISNQEYLNKKMADKIEIDKAIGLAELDVLNAKDKIKHVEFKYRGLIKEGQLVKHQIDNYFKYKISKQKEANALNEIISLDNKTKSLTELFIGLTVASGFLMLWVVVGFLIRKPALMEKKRNATIIIEFYALANKYKLEPIELDTDIEEFDFDRFLDGFKIEDEKRKVTSKELKSLSKMAYKLGMDFKITEVND